MGINVVFVGKVESKIGKFTVDPTIFTMVNLKLTVFRFFMFSVLAELQTLILDRPEEGRKIDHEDTERRTRRGQAIKDKKSREPINPSAQSPRIFFHGHVLKPICIQMHASVHAKSSVHAKTHVQDTIRYKDAEIQAHS